MKKEQKERHIFRCAMADIIIDSLRKRNMKYLDFKENTYENSNDMVHFKWHGKKCRLYEVAMPNLENGTMECIVRAKPTTEYSTYRITINISELRCKTMERIAYEVYDWLKDAEDKDFEEVRKEYVANWFDSDYNYL